MDVVEDQDVIVDMCIPMRRQLLPAIADVDAGELQAPQQRGGIDDVEKSTGFGGANIVIIEPKPLVQPPALDQVERQMPPLMNRETDRGRPVRLQVLIPADAFDGVP